MQHGVKGQKTGSNLVATEILQAGSRAKYSARVEDAQVMITS